MKFPGKTAVFLTACIWSAAAAQAEVLIDNPWARATVPGQPASGVFMELKPDTDTRLVGAESQAAQHVEIHEMAMQDNVMRMRQIPALDLPAGKTVTLSPGGHHIMLIGLQNQLKEGERIDLTLVFERDGKRETQSVEVPVRALTHGGPGAHGGQGHEGHGPHHDHGAQHGHGAHH